jgi:hypothetical protein
MNYDHITKYLEKGGVLTTSKSVHGTRATMHLKGREPVVGDHHTTLPDALTSLNSELGDTERRESEE